MRSQPDMGKSHHAEDEDSDEIGQLRFFSPRSPEYDAAWPVWNDFIEHAFPVHLFTLDPGVEEQNYVNAFSRLAQLQLAMAIAVAKGNMRQHRGELYAQLSMDMLAIGLNRTAVAFAHDNDTFGWYFYPRLQSPPTESSNIAAAARLIWSTGPTRYYDVPDPPARARHARLRSRDRRAGRSSRV